jgi:hypothetical protein
MYVRMWVLLTSERLDEFYVYSILKSSVSGELENSSSNIRALKVGSKTQNGHFLYNDFD